MATPFKVFRDNQKILMVVFGALLMVAFVVLPPILQLSSQNQQVRQAEGKVVVVVDDQQLYEEDVQRLQQKFDMVASIMGQAMRQSLILQGSPKAPMPPIPGLQIRQATRQSPGGPEFNPVGAEEAVLYYAWVKRAEEIGMVVDDQAVREFLKETSGGRLDDHDYLAILDLNTERRREPVTFDNFFEMVREVLMAQKLQALVFRDGRVVTPTAAWVAYRNLNRSISVELFPVSAKDFIDKVGVPTTDQLKKLFDEHKHQPNNPAMNQIGFMQMDKISLAYVKGDINNYIDAAKAEVTDAEVAAFYEENKDSYRKPTLPAAEPEAPASTESAKPMGEKPAEPTSEKPAEPMAEKPAAEMKSDEAKEEPKEDAAPEKEPAKEEPAKPETDSKPAETEKPAEEKPAEEPKSEEPKPEKPGSDESSQLGQMNPVRLVSFLQDEKTEEKPAEDKPAAEEPAPEKPAAEAPMTEAKPDAAPVVEDPKDAPEPEMPVTETPMDVPPVEYKPLAEVQDQIRTRLAQPIAQKRMEESLREMKQFLQQAYEEYRGQEEPDPSKSPYDSDKVAALAERLGLSFGAMALDDYYEASQTDFAQEAIHFDFVFDQGMPRQNTRSLVFEAFQANSPLYQPKDFPGATGTSRFGSPQVQFIYWKTGEKEGFAPTFEDVKDEVVEAWKQQEAAKLAKAKAEEIAKQIKTKEEVQKAATEAGGSVIVADNITYFNQLSGGQNMSLGTIPGVEDAGQQTMDALFATEVNRTAVAPNRGETVYYVAFVTGEGETDQQLRDNMLTSIQGALPTSVTSYVSQEESMITRAVLLDFFDPSRIDWKIDPMDLR